MSPKCGRKSAVCRRKSAEIFGNHFKSRRVGQHLTIRSFFRHWLEMRLAEQASWMMNYTEAILADVEGRQHPPICQPVVGRDAVSQVRGGRAIEGREPQWRRLQVWRHLQQHEPIGPVPDDRSVLEKWRRRSRFSQVGEVDRSTPPPLHQPPAIGELLEREHIVVHLEESQRGEEVNSQGA